ncbi:MAG: helix-turn-helix transcriptional regulator [Nevskia sp.]|nr:helix-turn-helix transcriptional regulator [Nevskia sp.]
MTKAQIIELGGSKAVVLPLKVYERLLERAEMLDDIESFDRAMARLRKGEETFPAEIARRIAAGESKVRIFREYRGLSQNDLAQAAGISVAGISKLEKTGSASIDTLAAIAERLDLAVDDLI